MRTVGEKKLRLRSTMPYLTSEMSEILTYVERDLENAELAQSIHFSPTALTFIRRLLCRGGTIFADTSHVIAATDAVLTNKVGMKINCYIDDPVVIATAEKRHVTRAEIAVDQALMVPGLKLFVVGSAPMAINRLLSRRQLMPMSDVAILATPVGYANTVAAKERIWESKMPAIVTRGNFGGAQAAASILNAIFATIPNK